MGGERESYAEKKPSTSGSGSAGQIRFHESGGQVHFHDDSAGLKAAVPVAEWWKTWERIRNTPAKWQWFDSVHNSILEVETQLILGTPLSMEAIISLSLGNFGVNYKALNDFTKKR